MQKEVGTKRILNADSLVVGEEGGEIISKVDSPTLRNGVDDVDPYDQPGCPMTWLIGILAGKWVFPVLYQLYVAGGPIRFAALQRTISRVTQKELTKTLRYLELEGFLTRTVYAEVPPRVEYAITEIAESLRDPILNLGEWAKANRPKRSPNDSTRVASNR